MNTQQVQDDLAFIRSMIQDNRRELVDNGVRYIANSIFVSLGLFQTFTLSYLGLNTWIGPGWFILFTLFLLVNILLQRKRRGEEARPKTFAQSLFQGTWFAVGVPLVIFTILYFGFHTGSLSLFIAFTSALLGVAYFLTGTINDFRFMKTLAWGWWIASVLAATWTSFAEEWQLGFFFSGLVLLFQIIPAILIRRQIR